MTLAVVAIVIGLVLARISVWLQMARFSSIAVLPILFGFAIGVTFVLLAGYFGIRRRILIVVLAVFASLATAAAEHGYFYLEYCRGCDTKFDHDLQSPIVHLFATLGTPPARFYATFFEFMSADAPAKWPLWMADALTMITVATIVAWLMMPNCRTTPSLGRELGAERQAAKP